MTDQTQQNDLLDAETFARVCKAMGHAARIQIIQHLKNMDRCVCGEIVEMLPLAQSTVSQHIKSLKLAGLVRGEIDGPCTCYCLDHEMLQRFKATVDSM